MARMRREQPLPPIPPEIDTLVLIDRQVDMITPMCSQLTYEGLLDEVHFLDRVLAPRMLGFEGGPSKCVISFVE